MAKVSRDYYNEIDKVLKEYEGCKSWHSKSMDWVSDRICWCAKWKKIPKEQIDELADRASEIFEQGFNYY